MTDVNGHIVLIGMVGAGKTTVGRLHANRLSWRFWDNHEALSRTDERHGGATALPPLPADMGAPLLGIAELAVARRAGGRNHRSSRPPHHNPRSCDRRA